MPVDAIKLEEVVDSEDELNLLLSETTTLAGSGSSTPAPPQSSQPRRHSSRKLVPNNASASVFGEQSPQLSRKRKVPHHRDVGRGISQDAPKKTKREDKKAATATANTRKHAVDAARKRWLYHHHALFSPLLPSSHLHFANLIDEIEGKAGKCAFEPLRQFERQPRSVVGGEMKDYQLEGLSFLAYMYHNGVNCILGDEMGLGKTLQTLSLFAYIKETSGETMDPHLIVCPLSVVETWIKEAAFWVPSLRMFRMHAQQDERDRLKLAVRDGNIQFDVCVTTYEGYVAEDLWFKSRRWTYVVLDEGHKIKNSDTLMAGKLQGINPVYKLILTGTPVQNNLTELWCLLHWLFPAIFTKPTHRLFESAFDLGQGTYSLDFLNAAEKLLSAVMLRRTKKTVDIKVPPRDELTVFVPMTEAQRFWTYRLLMRLDTKELEAIFTSKREDETASQDTTREYIADKLRDSKTGQQNQWKRLMNLLMQLRQVCDHPYILPDAEPTPYAIGEHLVASSSKLTVIDKLLQDILPKGEKVLIFTQWTNMLDLLEDFMVLRRISYARLDGSTPRPRRTLDIKLFQQENSPYQVYLISTKAGGLGINLTKASTVIVFDSEWNPQNDLQAIARAHRIGQTKVVKVYRLICQGSVEDQMLDRIRRKLFLSVKIAGFDNTRNDGQDKAMKTYELLDILRRGSSALSRSGCLTLSQFLRASISDILQASRTQHDSRAMRIKKEFGEDLKVEEQDQLILDAEEEEKRLLGGVAQVQSRLFEGQIVNRAKNNKEVAEEWWDLQKRVGQARVVMTDGYEVLTQDLGPRVDTTKASINISKQKFDWEDWCIHCRDGGELFMCQTCPRVFHAECQGLTKKEVEGRKGRVNTCFQHACAECGRNTASCGGMLFRCRTCPRALCEDCMPEGEIHAIGDTLPEFLLLGYGAKSHAYYIYCDDCHEQFEEDPGYWCQWKEEFNETDRKLAELWDA